MIFLRRSWICFIISSSAICGAILELHGGIWLYTTEMCGGSRAGSGRPSPGRLRSQCPNETHHQSFEPFVLDEKYRLNIVMIPYPGNVANPRPSNQSTIPC
ncbi:hypothetical protein V8F06_012350 [Rhypophila decipiens]